MLQTTPIKDLVVIEPKVFGDERGYFFESYSKKIYTKLGIDCNFIQDNQSFSKYGTIRGLHLQTGDSAQAKLVRVLEGEVIDVAVDLRKDSPTYGQHFSILLTAEKNNQFFIPRGFAHGFSVISPTAIFSYKCDNYYDPSSESGIIYNDSTLNIDWGIPSNKHVVSEKDLVLPTFEDYSKGL